MRFRCCYINIGISYNIYIYPINYQENNDTKIHHCHLFPPVQVFCLLKWTVLSKFDDILFSNNTTSN